MVVLTIYRRDGGANNLAHTVGQRLSFQLCLVGWRQALFLEITAARVSSSCGSLETVNKGSSFDFYHVLNYMWQSITSPGIWTRIYPKFDTSISKRKTFFLRYSWTMPWKSQNDMWSSRNLDSFQSNSRPPVNELMVVGAVGSVEKYGKLDEGLVFLPRDGMDHRNQLACKQTKTSGIWFGKEGREEKKQEDQIWRRDKRLEW